MQVPRLSRRLRRLSRPADGEPLFAPAPRSRAPRHFDRARLSGAAPDIGDKRGYAQDLHKKEAAGFTASSGGIAVPAQAGYAERVTRSPQAVCDSRKRALAEKTPGSGEPWNVSRRIPFNGSGPHRSGTDRPQRRPAA
ncbi:hypothetical protein GCM10007285_17450 [Stappia taiwanensis]|nr:hypothetical protein GCM10007285_17450 [Stappia taiwanensis]